jgi:hypothetical protein
MRLICLLAVWAQVRPADRASLDVETLTECVLRKAVCTEWRANFWICTLRLLFFYCKFALKIKVVLH